MPLLEIRHLSVAFGTGRESVRAVDDVTLRIEPGRTMGLVGESGSGKTLTALAIAGLLPTPPARIEGGEILLEGRDTRKMSGSELRRIRGGVVSYIFQEPATCLNPVLRVGAQIREALRLHRPEAATDAEVTRWLARVGIPEPELRRRDYPQVLSGGMQQRVMIAMALASQPRLLVADEPTTALDVTVQAQILDLLDTLRRELGMAILLITHNLGMVADLADDLAVMYAGQIVERGPAREVLREPRHPYTRALIASTPKLSEDVARLAAIPGAVPRVGDVPRGCRFHPRCPVAEARCGRESPARRVFADGREAACHLAVG